MRPSCFFLQLNLYSQFLRNSSIKASVNLIRTSLIQNSDSWVLTPVSCLFLKYNPEFFELKTFRREPADHNGLFMKRNTLA